MKTLIKYIIKKILKKLNYKLIKLNFPTPKTHPFPIPTDTELNLIKKSKGILHVGGHRGTEAAVYDWFNKKVVWIEADLNLFEELSINIRKHYNQKAICALIGNENKKKVPFYISNNDGACSSIFEFSNEVKNRKLWNDRFFFTKKKRYLDMSTLDETLKFHKINIAEYNHWIFDIQGAELMALQGASESIMYCKSIQIEISQKNYYEGGAKWMDIKNYLEKKNFYLSESPKKDHTEVLFIKKD